MADPTDVADQLIRAGDYDGAFALLQSAVADSNQPPASRADAFQLLGTLVQINPSFGDDDECGLSYYLRALKIDPHHLWALYGVISTYGPRFPDHQDDDACRTALDAISLQLHELDAEAQRFVREKRDILTQAQCNRRTSG